MVQLRNGGRYLLRNGSVITVDGCYYPFSNRDRKNHSYTSDGRYYANGRESQFDIIAEVTEEKEESVKSWTIEVGKFYRDEINQKWECLHIHNKVAFMVNSDNHHAMFDEFEGVSLYENEDIIGPWSEPLAIHWEYINPYTDRIEIVEQRLVLLGGEEQYGFLSVSQADHTAPGWREHIGETHYRDGRVERSKE